jgi:hypothetical protein
MEVQIATAGKVLQRVGSQPEDFIVVRQGVVRVQDRTTTAPGAAAAAVMWRRSCRSGMAAAGRQRRGCVGMPMGGRSGRMQRLATCMWGRTRCEPVPLMTLLPWRPCPLADGSAQSVEAGPGSLFNLVGGA